MRRLTIGFFHPNLGIGGAERLVVDAAVSLQKLGHRVVVYTMHHDVSHCFDETRDGTLEVRVGGGWLLPRSILGRLHIACTTLRGLWLARTMSNARENFDVVFVDQLSAAIPLLRFTRARILFYCHFPDFLQASHEGVVRMAYRRVFDWIEQATTAEADEVVVNSRFTQEVFRRAFPLIGSVPRVLLPPLNLAAYDRPVDRQDAALWGLRTRKRTVVSINRFERRKHVHLAVEAMAAILQDSSSGEKDRACLVVAGGWDAEVAENAECLRDLVRLAKSLGLRTRTLAPSTVRRGDARARLLPEDAEFAPLVADAATEDLAHTDVVFVPSFSANQRAHLLSQARCVAYTPSNEHLGIARCVAYTPSNEHLGIVPLEAMYMRVPVVAADSGGPRETVAHGKTGFLCEPTAEGFAAAIDAVLRLDDARWAAMGAAGRERVAKAHDLDAFGAQLERVMAGMLAREPNAPMVLGVALTLFIVGTAALVFVAVGFVF
ncbi:Alpha-1,3-mannosyltransferase-like protein [Coemansia interrupta]|uniref:Alpha-1,3/1,6-mannosyltransferase ALG2 n=1 Tax=Coemansia interrupta TaxID=1126814 RepID=A0A9W8HI78_9FUNG|nr:Alpha-1,3-mannosyltransferase-like protein [Coemansia interrupta]